MIAVALVGAAIEFYSNVVNVGGATITKSPTVEDRTKDEARLFLNLFLFQFAEDRPDFRNNAEQKRR